MVRQVPAVWKLMSKALVSELVAPVVVHAVVQAVTVNWLEDRLLYPYQVSYIAGFVKLLLIESLVELFL